ncbi:D-alanyl-D-alanine carboxypeptidase family protein [Bacillus suaedae]|uniref:D-alanyl-D-alanine carboxypeptidase n=1 Tax=Halalkalibacter suaedae TaxID=2822140 RepID=A0A941AMH4_9BACI|nr:D-alanyl-D-alanine carboxypeptidase [Bacillus suaedae]
MRKKWALISLVLLFLWPMFQPVAKADYRHVSAQGAILMEQESGRILFAKNADQPMRIASITKIMTALLAIESGKMDEMVEISTRAEGTEGSSIYLRAGEKMKLEDLVYGLMLRSGNDSAVAIAEHVGGSLEGFVYMMNEKAKQLGMLNTMFQNPHGLDDHEDHFSTAHDMALLTQYAMNYEDYQTIVSTKSHRVEGDQTRVWGNKNRLLTELYKYSTGGKTGYTKRAKRTLVSTASKEGNDYIVVTLNAPSDWHDHMNLFNWAFETYKVETLVEQGIIDNIEDEYYKDHVYAPYAFDYPLSAAERKALKVEMSLYEPPTSERADDFVPPQPVGKVELKVYDDVIGEVPLLYDPPVIEEKKGLWTRFLEIFSFTIGVRPDDK